MSNDKVELETVQTVGVFDTKVTERLDEAEPDSESELPAV
jgi:hypothetical protein